MKKLLTINTILITLLLLTGCAAKAPDKNTILESAVSLGINIMSKDNVSGYDGDPIQLEVKSCEITRQQTENKGNTTYCTISMSNDSLEATVDCVIYYNLFDDGKWYPSYYGIDSYSLIPLTGIDENVAIEFLAETLNAENKEISGFYDTYIYPSNYHMDVITHETDFDTLTDSLTFDYVKDSEICRECGIVGIDFAFNPQSGSWQCVNVDDSQINYEYHPEGQWRFDIYTGYVRIFIDDMDYVNNTATIYSYKSSVSGIVDDGGFNQSETVNFSITEEGMKFSPLFLPGDGIFVKDKEIVLLLTKDNMYWTMADEELYTCVSYKREADE